MNINALIDISTDVVITVFIITILLIIYSIKNKDKDAKKYQHISESTEIENTAKRIQNNNFKTRVEGGKHV
ncbi:hypothetical protein R83H12_02463 [Fibrobacteria bacterium R8-3-H12]